METGMGEEKWDAAGRWQKEKKKQRREQVPEVDEQS